MRRRSQRRSHVNHERWLVSYADFITLLFALFVVMFSAAQVDKKKVSKLAVAIQTAFRELGALPSANRAISTAPKQLQTSPPEISKVVTREDEFPDDSEEIENLRRELQESLATEIARNEVSIRRNREGLVISLKEIGFFESGSATVKTSSRSAFARIAKQLVSKPYHIRIEGHTDDVPIHNAQFASNWELSTSRATELIKLLIVQFGFSPDRLSAAGYAQYHPIADNHAPGGRSQNRRVDIVILHRQR